MAKGRTPKPLVHSTYHIELQREGRRAIAQTLEKVYHPYPGDGEGWSDGLKKGTISLFASGPSLCAGGKGKRGLNLFIFSLPAYGCWLSFFLHEGSSHNGMMVVKSVFKRVQCTLSELWRSRLSWLEEEPERDPTDRSRFEASIHHLIVKA